jgi:hypothetical protein
MLLCLYTGHLRSALGALLLVTWLSNGVRLTVPAVGADTITARPGSLRATHPARPASAAAASTTTTSTSTSTTSTHLTHLLSSSMPARLRH